MFKSSFAKYLSAFIIITFVSFLILSSIITSMVRTHVTADKEDKLEMSSTIVSDFFVDNKVENIESFIKAQLASPIVTLIPLINLDYDFHILVTDPTGRVLLSTVQKNEDGTPSTHGNLGQVNISDFTETAIDGNDVYYIYKGNLDGIVSDKYLVYAKTINYDDSIKGYAIAMASTTNEDRLIQVMRSTVINSSIWIMLASVIAAYFITDRIVHPLKNMTRAAKRFARGDFSLRVPVEGRDEVAELAVAFNNMADSLDSLEKMRNSFLANVSHDLRTPMTTISGFIDGITSGAIPPEEHNHYLGIISTEVHRLSRLVSQILDISRMESGDRKFNYVDFDVAEVTRIIIISFEQQLEGKRLDVEFSCDEDSMYAYADKDAIYQVIYNLCHNAIKFSRDEGKFRISITRTQEKKIKISVYDDGQILTEEDAAHIFDRFYKSDKSRGLDKTGVGLGLYICKTIVEAHGESIALKTHSDGCEFWFTLKEGTNPKHKH